MDEREALDRLKVELESLQARQRRLVFLVAAAFVAGALTAVPGASGFLRAADEKADAPKPPDKLVLRGPDDATVTLTLSKYVGVDKLEHRSLDFLDEEGNLRGRLAWVKRPDNRRLIRAVTSFGIYAGKDNVIQELPID